MPVTMLMSVRQRSYVGLSLRLPLETTLPVQLLVASPVADRRSVFHLTDVRFDARNRHGAEGEAVNVVGVAPTIDILRTYDVDYTASGNVTRHMQRDRLIVDFGLVTSAGYSRGWGRHSSLHDTIYLEVGMLTKI